MKNIFIKICILVMFCVCFYNISFGANVVYDFIDEKEIKENYDLYSTVQDLDLDMEVIEGPGYEDIKSKTDSDDIYINLNYIDEHYEDVLNITESKIIYADSSKLKVGKGGNSTGDNNRNLISGRNKKIDASIRIRNKLLEDSMGKEDKEKEEQGEKSVSIYIRTMADNPNNPEPGVAYIKTYKFKTDCETLIELLNQEGISSDDEFITVVDGIDAYEEIESTYSADGHGMWKGKSWMLYVNGKQADVGANLIELEDGTRIRIIQELQTMTW